VNARRLWPAVALALWAAYLLLPVYALVAMALRTNESILSERAVVPTDPTFANFAEVLTDPSWYVPFGNSLGYVAMNTVISMLVALPAAYGFSRYRFTGDSHLFFWLLTNRMSPPAVFLLPVFQLYSSVGLFDTPLAVALAHCLFTVPLAVWILEGFMSAVPREIDELAKIDGHRFPFFFVRLFLPLVRAGIGVAIFFCFMFSWVELLLARTLTASGAKPIVVAMTRTVSASGLDWGVLAAVGVLTVLPGLAVVWFVRGYLVKGFALGRV
jgi:glycerol transport system permease protein